MIEVDVDIDIPSITGRDWAEIAKSVAQIMLDGVREQFVSGGIPTWQPLKSGGPSFLFRSGALLTGIVSSTGSDGSVHWARVSTSGNLPYEFIHQFGGYAGRNRAAYIPPRPYMVVTERTHREILNAAAGMVVEILNTPQKAQRFKDNR